MKRRAVEGARPPRQAGGIHANSWVSCQAIPRWLAFGPFPRTLPSARAPEHAVCAMSRLAARTCRWNGVTYSIQYTPVDAPPLDAQCGSVSKKRCTRLQGAGSATKWTTESISPRVATEPTDPAMLLQAGPAAIQDDWVHLPAQARLAPGSRVRMTTRSTQAHVAPSGIDRAGSRRGYRTVEVTRWPKASRVECHVGRAQQITRSIPRIPAPQPTFVDGRRGNAETTVHAPAGGGNTSPVSTLVLRAANRNAANPASFAFTGSAMSGAASNLP